MWRNDGQARYAVVQSVNAEQRTAQAMFVEGPELVSVLELDMNGPDDGQAMMEDIVRVGDMVFLHPDGATNGVSPPRIPVIGEDGEWIHEPMKLNRQGKYVGWRGDFETFGHNIVQTRNDASRGGRHPIYDNEMMSPECGGQSIDWLGEVSKASRRFPVKDGLLMESSSYERTAV